MSISAPDLRTQVERDQLVEQYLPLVRYVVARLHVTMPATLDRDDFFSVGVIGLLHAATTYDPTRGASFKTFAYTAIRGAILDEIRKHDPVPRNRRDRLRILDRTAASLHGELGRPATLDEIAERMEVTVDDLDSDLLALHTHRLLSLDNPYGEDSSLGQNLTGPMDDLPDPIARAVQHEELEALTKAISQLPDTDRNVIVLYHYEGLYLKEVGEILGVSESRVSQILTRATARLRLKLQGS